MGRSFALIADRMEEASRDLRQTLNLLGDRKESVEAEAALRRNLRQFVEASRSLEHGLEHFDESVAHSLEKIDLELAGALERLSRITRELAERRTKEGESPREEDLFFEPREDGR